MIRKHLSKSTREVHRDLRNWVARCPYWLQPPLYGVVFVYAFALARGGLILLPIGIIAFIFGSPSTRASVGPLLAAGLFYAPLAGFLGGCMYALVRPVLQHLGILGRYLQFVLGAWVYALVLMFIIIPVIKPADKLSLNDPAGWIISAFIGLIFGSVLAAQDRAPEQKPATSEPMQTEPPNARGAA